MLTVLGSVVAFFCLCAVIAGHQAQLESVGRQVMANRGVVQQQAQATARQAAFGKPRRPGEQGAPSVSWSSPPLAVRTAAGSTTRAWDHVPTVRGSSNQLAVLVAKRRLRQRGLDNHLPLGGGTGSVTWSLTFVEKITPKDYRREGHHAAPLATMSRGTPEANWS